MPHVVPSAVVASIDRMFGPNRAEHTEKAIGIEHRNQVRTLLSLLDVVPPDLLAVPIDRYIGFLEARSSLSFAVNRWDVGDSAHRVDTAGRGDPIEKIRRTLRDCPDEDPPAHPDLFFVEDEDARAGILEDIRASWIDFRANEWKGATLFAAVAVESLLFWTLLQTSSPQDAKRLKTLTLGDYVQEAKKASIIRNKTADQAMLAVDGRNLIHPGRAARSGSLCSKSTALTSLAALEAVLEDLSRNLKPNGEDS